MPASIAKPKHDSKYPILTGGPWWVSCLLLLALIGSPVSAAIAINEIDYEPEDKLQPLEFVELLNTGPDSVDLGGWEFTDGIDFVFPSPTVLAPGEYLVIAEDPPALDGEFGTSSIGPFSGSLSNDGENLELSNAGGDVIDAVDYLIEFPWPLNSSGQGSSMELMNPALNNSLGSSWRASSGSATPGGENSIFRANPPPQIESASHSPGQPTSSEAPLITARVTDSSGVRSVTVTYQIVQAGNYIPAELPLTHAQLLADADQPRTPNLAFENPANWIAVSIRDDGTEGDAVAGDHVFSAFLPLQANRTLMRYRILATDDTLPGVTVRAPYEDDPSLNFAYYVYDGIPPYTPTDQTVHPNGLGHSYSPEILTSLPTYNLITRFADLFQCMAWTPSFEIPSSNRAARSAFNWEGAFVYDGVVYDHVHYRLRGHNQRYQLNQKRNMRFRFNRGLYFQAHDQQGRPYPTRWRSMLFAKMYGPRDVGNFGIAESMNNFLFNLVGVPAPYTHCVHFRVVDAPDESPMGPGGQFNGDFWGMFLAMEDYDSRFLDAHQMEKGNLYKLTDGQTDGLEQLRYQSADAVSNAEDYNNIVANLHPAASLAWLESHIDWEHWYRYETVQQAIRHYDLGVYPDRENLTAPVDTPALKNIAWFFRPDSENPLGKMMPLPWDSEQSWGENGAHQGWDMPLYAIVDPQISDGRAKVNYTGGPRQKEELYIGYRNFIREFRDLIWNEEVLPPMIDRYAAIIQEFVPADRDRWRNHPYTGTEISDFGPLEPKVEDMKIFAFVGGTHWPVLDRPNTSRVDPGGRAAELDERSNYGGDALAIPDKPTIAARGNISFPASDLVFEASPFSDPQGPGTFAAMKWRLGEITDPTAPSYDPIADPIYEWNELWSSGELTTFASQVQIPPTAVEPGHTYRVRCRMKDDTGRWGHWSDPVQFTVEQIPTHNPGDIIITELFGNAVGNDDFKEWFEVYNTTDADIDIRGWEILDNETDFHSITGPNPVIVPSKGYLILAESGDNLTNGGVPFDYSYNDELTLGNSADELILREGATVIHSVGYGAFEPGPHPIISTIPAAPPEGGAIGMGTDYCLKPVLLWVPQTSAYGTEGSLGTPGLDNDGVPVCQTDLTPPVLVEAQLGRSNVVVIAFNEPLDATSALEVSNYSVSLGVGSPTSISLLDNRTVVLEFETPLATDTVYSVDASNIADEALNVAEPPLAATLSYSIPPVSISEIMYNNRGDDIEWIELLNTTNSAIDISGWYLTDDDAYPAAGEGNGIIPPGTVIDSGEYIVINLWGSAGFSTWMMPAAVRVVDGSVSEPGSLSNSGDNVALFNATSGGQLIDGTLSGAFPDVSEDGESIEKIEEDFPWRAGIATAINWMKSTTPIGFETGLNENQEFLSSFASPGRGVGTGISGPTPTPTETQLPTPTPTETRSYDIAPAPEGDGDINAKDLLLFLDRVHAASEESEVLFDFSRFWNE